MDASIRGNNHQSSVLIVHQWAMSIARLYAYGLFSHKERKGRKAFRGAIAPILGSYCAAPRCGPSSRTPPHKCKPRALASLPCGFATAHQIGNRHRRVGKFLEGRARLRPGHGGRDKARPSQPSTFDFPGFPMFGAVAPTGMLPQSRAKCLCGLCVLCG